MAPGTPALAAEHAAAFDAAFDAVRERARQGLGELWVSRWSRASGDAA